jgi:hypothetical protein
MYFAARVDGRSHLWRQRYPSGQPEQITSGPTEEEGVAVAPDGRSLITAVGTRQSSIWIHDGTGERAVSSEGFAVRPQLSPDGKRIYYLLYEQVDSTSGELRSIDLSSGKSDTLLPGLSVDDFTVSADERTVVFTTRISATDAQIWLAPLDHSSAPHLITKGGDQPSFGPEGEVLFRQLGENKNFLARIKTDGSSRVQISDLTILNKFGTSGDGEWTAATIPGRGTNLETVAIQSHGGVVRRICPDVCPSFWTMDGKVFVSFYQDSPNRTMVVALKPGSSIPEFPDAGISPDWKPPGLGIIMHNGIAPSSDISTYAFTQTGLQRNLFRIPIH